MAKRFTDTNKWNLPWFRKLGSQGRDLWNYLHENCDHAGLFDIDCEKLSFVLGFEVSKDLIFKVLRNKLHEIKSDKIFLPAFIDFQYGKLSETSKPHASVIKKLKNEGVWEGYVKGMYTLKEKEKEEDKEQEKEKEKEKEEDKESSPMSFLFPDDAIIQSWLSEGDFKIQKEILLANSHHVLVEEIKKAFVWQYTKEKRKADGFLYTWIRNVNNQGYGLNRPQVKISGGNKYQRQLDEKYGKEGA